MEISPNEVVFTPPFEEVRSTQLHLQNTTNHTLIYKVKTTTPQLYSVRPNAASVEAGKTLSVEITRQGRPYSESEGRDKFLILSTVLDPELATDPETSIAQIWTQLESSGSSAKIDARKLRVVTHNAHSFTGQQSKPSSDGNSSSHSHNVEGAAAGATTGSTGHINSNKAQSESQAPKTISEESRSTEFTPSPSTGANHNLPQQPSEHHSSGFGHHQAANQEHQHSKEHESSKSSSQSTKSAGSSSLPAQGSGPNGEVTVDDLQGTPGVPPKSRMIDEGDALTGPKLANSKLPDGPKASHGLDSTGVKNHDSTTGGKLPNREAPNAAAVGKSANNGKHADEPKSTAGHDDKSPASQSAADNDQKAESSAQAAAGSKGSQTDYLETAGEYAHQAREQAGEYAEAAKENLQLAGTTAANATVAAAGAAAGYVSGATTNVANWLQSKDVNADDPNSTTYEDSETSFHENSRPLGGFDHSVNSGGFKAAGAQNGAEQSIAGGPKTFTGESQPGPSADVHYGVVNLGEPPKPSASSHHKDSHHTSSHHQGATAVGAAVGSSTGAGLSNLSSQGSSADQNLHNQARSYENQVKSASDSGVENVKNHAQSLKQSVNEHTKDAQHNTENQIPSELKNSSSRSGVQEAIHTSGHRSETGGVTTNEAFTGFDKTINGPAANVGGAYTKNEPESQLLQSQRDTLAFQGNSATTSGGTTTATAQTEGAQQVDVTTAAILALVAFLIGWKFF